MSGPPTAAPLPAAWKYVVGRSHANFCGAREEVTVGGATYLRRPGKDEKQLYVIGRISEEEGLKVLCVTSVSGVKTLPVFSRREAARRFLRASPLRFNQLASGWRTRRISESDSGSLLVGAPDGIEIITLDPSPETLFGKCAAEPLPRVT